MKASRLEVHFQNKVPLTLSLSRLLPDKSNSFFLNQRALKEMLPRRARSYCGWFTTTCEEGNPEFPLHCGENRDLDFNQLPEKQLGCSQGPLSWLPTGARLWPLPRAGASPQHGSAHAVRSWRKAHPELAGAQAVGEKRLLTPGIAPTLTDSQCCTRSHMSVSELRFTPPSEAKIIQTDAQLQVLDSLQGQTLPQRLHQAPAHASKAKQGSFPSQRPQELLTATSKGKI